MTQGIGGQFLSSVLRDTATLMLRDVQSTWFVEDERTAFDFVMAHYREHGQLPDLATVNTRFQFPPSPEPVSYYFGILRDRATYNELTALHSEFITAMRNRDMESARGAVRSMSIASSSISQEGAITTLEDQGTMLWNHFVENERNHGNIGITLGYEKLDELTDGAQPGDLIIVVARPGIGKTYLLLKMLQAARNAGHSSLLVSMEMGSRQITTRMAAIDSGINTKFIRRRQLTTHGRQRFFDTLQGYQNVAPVHFMEGNLRRSVQDVDSAILELSPSIAYLDAGYLIKGSKTSGSSRRESISDVIEELKEVALARGIAMVVTVQFNRTVKRNKHTLNLDLGSIGETDVLGQIGSIVIAMQPSLSPYETTRRHISLLKNREGDTGEFNIRFEFQPMNFDFVATENDDTEIEDGWND